MFAVLTTGGKQYRVEAGNELMIERLAGDAGSSITFDRVLLLGDGDTVTVGTPTVPGATVTATVLGEARGPKLIIFKFKQKVKYRRRTGHRQHLTRVRIDGINAAGSKPRASEAAPAAAEADAPPKRTRRAAAATSDATDEKPKRTRKPAAAKAKPAASEE